MQRWTWIGRDRAVITFIARASDVRENNEKERRKEERA
jgi:hypothetical protein